MKDVAFKTNSVWRNNIQFESGKDYLISAPSGTGKTSLFSFIYGVRKDFSGEILINDKKTSSVSLNEWAELRKRKIAYIPQDLKLLPTLTVIENLEVKNKLTHHRTKEQIIKMLEALGVRDKQNQKCGTLSLGQQQRVTIVRSLLQPFEFILMDEPFSHIDDENIKHASGLITNECRANGGNFIMVSLGNEYLFNYSEKLLL